MTACEKRTKVRGSQSFRDVRHCEIERDEFLRGKQAKKYLTSTMAMEQHSAVPESRIHNTQHKLMCMK